MLLVVCNQGPVLPLPDHSRTLLQSLIPQIQLAAGSRDRPRSSTRPEKYPRLLPPKPTRWLLTPQGAQRPPPLFLPRVPAMHRPMPAPTRSCAPTRKPEPSATSPIGKNRIPLARPLDLDTASLRSPLRQTAPPRSMFRTSARSFLPSPDPAMETEAYQVRSPPSRG